SLPTAHARRTPHAPPSAPDCVVPGRAVCADVPAHAYGGLTSSPPHLEPFSDRSVENRTSTTTQRHAQRRATCDQFAAEGPPRPSAHSPSSPHPPPPRPCSPPPPPPRSRRRPPPWPRRARSSTNHR